ncbi:MAG: DUF2264 domain-containing protein [Lachnospiraceae bacterium]|nr:DUF2264 domain-containing protein [Lachnospiraceae bacterium]
MKLEPKYLDFELSPFTGLTRDSFVDAGKYLLDGIFSNISSIENPIVMPRKETEITYPHLNAPEDVQDAEKRAEVFEGLTRSFFIASVLINEDPDLNLAGIPIREYYKKHILRCCLKDDPVYIGTYDELQEITGNSDPFRCFQQTVETCALVIGLWASKSVLWDTYDKSEKDAVAALISSYARASTVPQNWRLFNMLDMAFLYNEGYEIDEKIMYDHAQAILGFYAGNGWYRDGHSFDYYSCWAFNFYAPLWCRWYGYEHAPELAEEFEKNSNELMKTYGRFFDREGYVNMWGRSCIYRNAAVSAFDGNTFLNDPAIPCGWARRITSGALLQFFGRDDVLFKGIPELGFYGQFSPLVQGYSCAESPFWLGKAFLCLHLDKDHPFWTEKENEGDWEGLGTKVLETALDGPALCFTDHGANGETNLRTGKVVKAPGDIHGMWNYSKLVFNTKYPWESTPVNPENGSVYPGVESQQYVLTDIYSDREYRANVTYWYGRKNDVLYRRQYFDYDMKQESFWTQGINLADFAVPYGIFRVDKHKLFRRPVRFTLGSFGFPDNGTAIRRLQRDGAKAIILKGHDHMGREKQMAMTVWDGFEKLEVIQSKGTNPDSERSFVICATGSFLHQYDASEPYCLISQVLTKENAEEFTDDDIFPLASIVYKDHFNTGAYGDILLNFRDGRKVVINFDNIEGNLTI